MRACDFPFDCDSLRQVAYRTATRILRSPVLAEEAGERALHQLTLMALSGQTPNCPEAWIRVVARRSAGALLRRGWARTVPLAEEGPCLRHEPDERRPAIEALWESLQGSLTPRQRDALDAARTHRCTRGAAAACGMAPRDFRRYLQAISRRARAAIALEEGVPPC